MSSELQFFLLISFGNFRNWCARGRIRGEYSFTRTKECQFCQYLKIITNPQIDKIKVKREYVNVNGCKWVTKWVMWLFLSEISCIYGTCYRAALSICIECDNKLSFAERTAQRKYTEMINVCEIFCDIPKRREWANENGTISKRIKRIKKWRALKMILTTRPNQIKAYLWCLIATTVTNCCFAGVKERSRNTFI